MSPDELITLVTWLGIAFCISQSAMFSGLNLALFGISRLQLEVRATAGQQGAIKILGLRKDANFLLATILWGNVAANCLLTILSDSILAGVTAFFFSTILITFVGEIIPQAYFSRHALTVASRLAPAMRFYQMLLFPIAKPTALMLDAWLGVEGIRYYKERHLREVIQKHVESSETDLDHVEGRGALNFLSLDDLPVSKEGEPVDPASIVTLPTEGDRPVFPPFEHKTDDPFVQELVASGKKWTILVDPGGQPHWALNADAFVHGLATNGSRERPFSPLAYCHRPIVVRDPAVPLGEVIDKFRVQAEHKEDDVIDRDIILVWSEQKRVITGADLLGRLLRGIVRAETTAPFQMEPAKRP